MNRLHTAASAVAVPVKLAEVRQLVDAGALSDANTEVIGVKGGYKVFFLLRKNYVRVLATKGGEMRVFSTADSALRQLRAVDVSLGNVVVKSSTYQPAALRPAREDRRQAMQQANDYGRWLKAETDATLARVASGAATIYTQAEFDKRSAERRAAIVRRRNEAGA